MWNSSCGKADNHGGIKHLAAMKPVDARPYAKPEAAAAKLIEIAQGLRVDEGRMSVGKWNDAFRAAGGNVAEYSAGRDHAIASGIIQMHECGGFVMWTAGAPPE